MTPRRHLLFDIWVEDRASLSDLPAWQACLEAGAEAAGATVLHSCFHQFQPEGLTGFLMLAESHISVHTWPAEGYAAIDLFTCGSMEVERILAPIRQRFTPREEALTRHHRGTSRSGD
jgi:S-adenosylmethionine decarboxylase